MRKTQCVFGHSLGGDWSVSAAMTLICVSINIPSGSAQITFVCRSRKCVDDYMENMQFLPDNFSSLVFDFVWKERLRSKILLYIFLSTFEIQEILVDKLYILNIYIKISTPYIAKANNQHSTKFISSVVAMCWSAFNNIQWHFVFLAFN